jgi:hypothetical protein
MGLPLSMSSKGCNAYAARITSRTDIAVTVKRPLPGVALTRGRGGPALVVFSLTGGDFEGADLRVNRDGEREDDNETGEVLHDQPAGMKPRHCGRDGDA